VYVGSTNKEGLTFARFQEHLREGRPGAANFRQNKAEWLRLVSAGGGDTEVGASFRRWGEIKVEVKEHGEFTDLGLAILEEAHIRKFDENQLQNRVEALSEKAFKEYYNPSDPSKKNYSLSHEPCR
jgi:hypothetical protein